MARKDCRVECNGIISFLTFNVSLTGIIINLNVVQVHVKKNIISLNVSVRVFMCTCVCVFVCACVRGVFL